MPRCARIKQCDGIYHIMMRSITELQLFKDKDDKEKYLQLFSKYQKIFLFKIYAFCLMNNHAHFIIDSNGADISKFMHQINQCYAQYYNKKYNRHGHVFGDRFKSILIKNDIYLKNVSAYIHNNPKDIRGYENNVQDYEYSSFNSYIGTLKESYIIVDTNFILQQFSKNVTKSKELYFNFVMNRLTNTQSANDPIDFEFMNQHSDYISNKELLLRNFSYEDVINYISQFLNIPATDIHIKHIHKSSNFRSICILFLRCFCDFKHSDLCKLLGNISISQISKLCNKGYYLIHEKKEYSHIVDDFLKKYKSA